MIYFFLFQKLFKKSKVSLTIIDQKIVEFRNRSFSSDEEKTRAKEKLKIELMDIANHIKSGLSATATLGLRQQAISKIMLL